MLLALFIFTLQGRSSHLGKPADFNISLHLFSSNSFCSTLPQIFPDKENQCCMFGAHGSKSQKTLSSVKTDKFKFKSAENMGYECRNGFVSQKVQIYGERSILMKCGYCKGV